MTVTVEDMAAATRRSAVTLASDPATRHYSPETIALVHERTVLALAGCGDLAVAAARIVEDEALAGVPFEIVNALMPLSFQHFARALGRS